MIALLFLLSMLPGRQPQLAAGHGKIGMAFGAPDTIFYAASSDGGRSFGAPVKVAELPALMLGRHRGPRLTILDGALLITALAKQGDLTAWRSTDDGKTWARASAINAAINDVPAAAREGLHAVAAGLKGAVFAAWLDQRAAGMRLYGARSANGGVTWSKNVQIYAAPGGTICECCAPSVQIDAAGRVWAMWRNVVEGSRDMFMARSADGGKFGPAEKLGVGTWKINACPMDGGGFFVNGEKVTSAWRRESGIFFAEAGAAERQVGTGMDVQIAHGLRGAYLAWTRKGGGIQVLLPGAARAAMLSEEGGYVTMVPLSDGSALAAWETPGGIQFKRLD